MFFLGCSSIQAAEGHISAFTPLLLHDLGLTPAEIAVWTRVLVAVMNSMALPLAPFWGVLAERYSRRPVVVRGCFVLSVALLVAAWTPTVHWLILVRLLMGLCSGTGGVIIATQALITPRNRLGSAIAMIQSSQPIAASLGPPLGALAIPLIGLRGLFVVDACVVVAAGLALVFLMPEPPLRVRSGSVLGRTGEVLKLVWASPAIHWNFGSSFLMRGASSVVDGYLPVRITQLVPDPATATDLILGVYVAMTTVATWVVGRLVDRTNAAVLYWRAMLFATVLIAGLALAQSVWLVGVLAVLRSIPVACSNTILYAHAARVLPAEEQSAVFAVSPVPRNAAQLAFPLLAAAIVGLAPGAALLLGSLSNGATVLAGLRMAALTGTIEAPLTVPAERLVG